MLCQLAKDIAYLPNGLCILCPESARCCCLVFCFAPVCRLIHVLCSGHADDAYYLADKDNKCVVCGHTGDYLRHSIVPHCYRSVRLFTHHEKAFKHDLEVVQLLCRREFIELSALDGWFGSQSTWSTCVRCSV